MPLQVKELEDALQAKDAKIQSLEQQASPCFCQACMQCTHTMLRIHVSYASTVWQVVV